MFAKGDSWNVKKIEHRRVVRRSEQAAVDQLRIQAVQGGRAVDVDLVVRPAGLIVRQIRILE